MEQASGSNGAMPTYLVTRVFRQWNFLETTRDPSIISLTLTRPTIMWNIHYHIADGLI